MATLHVPARTLLQHLLNAFSILSLAPTGIRRESRVNPTRFQTRRIPVGNTWNSCPIKSKYGESAGV